MGLLARPRSEISRVPAAEQASRPFYGLVPGAVGWVSWLVRVQRYRVYPLLNRRAARSTGVEVRNDGVGEWLYSARRRSSIPEISGWPSLAIRRS